MRKEEKCGTLFSACDMAIALLNFLSNCEYSEEICVRLDPLLSMVDRSKDSESLVTPIRYAGS